MIWLSYFLIIVFLTLKKYDFCSWWKQNSMQHSGQTKNFNLCDCSPCYIHHMFVSLALSIFFTIFHNSWRKYDCIHAKPKKWVKKFNFKDLCNWSNLLININVWQNIRTTIQNYEVVSSSINSDINYRIKGRKKNTNHTKTINVFALMCTVYLHTCVKCFQRNS